MQKFIGLGMTIIPIALSCIILVFGFFGRPSGVEYLINADSLLPAHMAWDVAQHDYALANFQWPRVLALPDLAFFFAAEGLGLNWRTSYLVYTCLIVSAAILAMGWVVMRMRTCSYREAVFGAGMMVATALLVAFAGFALSPDEPLRWIPQVSLIMCVTHGHSFILSLVAYCTALNGVRGNRRQAWITWGLCAFATFSDTIFVGYFLLPFAIAGLLVAFTRRGAASEISPGFTPLARFAAAAIVACLIGWIAKIPLPTQEMKFVFHGLDKSLAVMLSETRRAPWIIGLAGLTLGLSIWAIGSLFRRRMPAQSSAEVDREWLVLAGLAASVMSLGLAALFYIDYDGYRYAVPFLWWPLLIALGSMPLPKSATSNRMLQGGSVAVAAIAVAASPLSASALPHWRAPLEKCLSDNRQNWGLQAGLATYSLSRQIMGSSDWKLQVDQITEEGSAYFWGNDFAAYKHDIHAAERAPHYNFIVVDDAMDPFSFETLFGIPARTESCGDRLIWIYDQPIVPPGIDDRPERSVKLKFISSNS